MIVGLADCINAREDWMADALCAQIDCGDMFFPESKGASPRAAKEVCAMCPVRLDCLAYALDHGERFGVWGGLSERERRQFKPAAKPATHCARGHSYARTGKRTDGGCAQCKRIQDRERKRSGLRQHGTRSMYTAGCRCDACTEANRKYAAARWKPRSA